MPFKFEKLRVWQHSFDLAEKIVIVADDFPDKERYNLNFQIRRAADSIGLILRRGQQAKLILSKRDFWPWPIGPNLKW